MKTLYFATLATLILGLGALASASPIQNDNPNSRSKPAATLDEAKVSISSKGDDLRTVIASVFEQTKQQYVIQIVRRQGLYLSLDNSRLDTALDIISNLADVDFSLKNGIWFVTAKKKVLTKIPKVGTEIQTAAQPFADPFLPSAPVPVVPKISKGLAARLTTKLKRTNIREVFEMFTAKTGVQIVVDETVPNYTIDAYMVKTSLKFALDKVTKAAGLKYDFNDGKTVRISKA